MDQFTIGVNRMNTDRWTAEANAHSCRLCLTMGICPDGSIRLFMAAQMPPADLIKMLRACADSMESQSTGKIILPV